MKNFKVMAQLWILTGTYSLIVEDNMPIPANLRITVSDNTKPSSAKALFIGCFKGEKPCGGAYDNIDNHAVRTMQEMVDSGEITGDYKEFTTLPLKGGNFDVAIVMGLGKKEDYSLDRFRSCAAKAARTLRKICTRSMALFTDSFGDFTLEEIASTAAEGVVMGLYKFPKIAKEDKNATKIQVEELVLIAPAEATERVKAAAERGSVIAFATNYARDLANLPANFATPEYLVEQAQAIAAEGNLTCTIHDREALEKIGAGGILSVARGSVKQPFLIEIEYSCGNPDAPTVALIGKGITFDSGGISIKPSDGMHLMKYDMHGSATVLGVMKIFGQIKPDVNILCLVPTCENMPDADAYRPGDVIRMYDGQHVEIISTDAEGRMLLADALAIAAERKVDLMVDVATLTGAIVVALGHIATGIFSNNAVLTREIIDAGLECDELAWEMPMFKEFEIQLGSMVADLKNSGGRAAGSCTAGLFLKKFVKDIPWIHMDIAGVAWMEEDSTLYNHKPYLPKKGATGVAVRTLNAFIRRIADSCGSDKSRLQEILKG
ncbi:MAG: leucyl aminopeptidase [Candidatus Wallbacteria bacterium HGW-Wallbacteria-1]|uniref:Probable cytosol aminopeptidase n=1 Tax=Candidatus Wallbacteria bacterium HGW-Wallbacteria-1 TaxID=2013854 RepID=A0A2N1PV29_9BACT|nr:MAG: leucyl aminopeptidase [Candidatus Wallbacteria bacterium HGW-Wallbacteria-1]